MTDAKLHREGNAYILRTPDGSALGSVIPDAERPGWWTVAYADRTRDMYESYNPHGGDKAQLAAAVRVMKRAVR